MLKHKLLGHLPEFLIHWIWDENQGFAFLMYLHTMLLLLERDNISRTIEHEMCVREMNIQRMCNSLGKIVRGK